MKRKATQEPDSEEFSDSASDEDVEENNEEQNDGVPEPLKKKSKADLYKIPTNEEMASLREIEHLQESSLFRLQIKELLNQLLLKEKKKNAAGEYVKQLSDVLLKLPSDIDTELSEQEWVSDAGLRVPFLQAPYDVKGRFVFLPPRSVTAIGSFVLGPAIKPQPHIDLALEIPKESLQAKDHLNQRYLRKRALYLVAVAKHLTHCPLVDSLSFTYHHGNQLKPLLVIKPHGPLAKSLSIRLHTSIEEGAFKPARFHPARSNIRSQWYSGQPEDTGDDTTGVSTPYYNQAVLRDMYLLAPHDPLTPGLLQGIALLKLWLRLRQMHEGHGCLSGFVLTQYVLYLVKTRQLSAKMSSFQVLRKTLENLANSDWLSSPPSLAPASADLPSLTDFQQHFEVVFVDASGWINLCSDMTPDTYRMVRHEAGLSLPLLENMSIDSFSRLLQQPVRFYDKYDQALSIRRLGELSHCVDVLGCEGELMDRGGDVIATVLPHFLRLIRHGAGHRIIAMATRPQPASTRQWSVTEEPPAPLSDPAITIGFLCNPDTCDSLVDKGPAYNSPQEQAWREFWGERSELRRFKDSSTVEAVVWRGRSLAERRSVLARSVRYILHKHTGVARNCLQSIVCQLDPLLQPQGTRDPTYGTGDEQQTKVVEAYEKLSRRLRKLSNLPLTIITVHGLDAVLRHTEVFPADGTDGSRKPAYQVLCVLEGSGKWPEDIEAVQYMKAAFRVQLSRELSKQHQLNTTVYPHCVDVLQDGYVFRLDVAYLHEVQLLRLVRTVDGMLKQMDTEEATTLEQRIIAAPKLYSQIHGLSQQYSSYGPATRLAKHWLRAQLLCEHYIPDEAVELLMAAVYMHPAPYAVPGTPLTGFIRFLRLLATHDWKTAPLIVNFNNALKKDELAAVESQFSKHRSTLPWMFIATPDDPNKSRWTKARPSAMILSRAVVLASHALSQLEAKLDDPTALTGDFKALFRPALESYDAVLELMPDTTRHADFDPAQTYLHELREAFEDYALFFHDPYGGQYISVLWKPATAQSYDFKISHMAASKPTLSDPARPHLSFQRDDVLADFRLMGKGLLKAITKPAGNR